MPLEDDGGSAGAVLEQGQEVGAVGEVAVARAEHADAAVDVGRAIELVQARAQLFQERREDALAVGLIARVGVARVAVLRVCAGGGLGGLGGALAPGRGAGGGGGWGGDRSLSRRREGCRAQGAGGCDVPGNWRLLLDRGYQGWITLDLDPPRANEGEGTVEEKLRINRRFVVETLGAQL